MKFHYPINKADMSAFPEIPHTVAFVSREQAVLALNKNRKKN